MTLNRQSILVILNNLLKTRHIHVFYGFDVTVTYYGYFSIVRIRISKTINKMSLFYKGHYKVGMMSMIVALQGK